ncbi:MAG: Holliday junction resolvase RuvX [Chitinispirillaceae bacterium]|jgi:putative Holliday junction resolvase
MKLIGVDYGRRRIGMAATDETGTAVRGLATIDRKKHGHPLLPLLAVIERERPGALVFGLPLDADDRETSMATEIRKFAADLEKKISFPVYFIDESLTSKQASELLRFRKKKERRNKEAVDRIAACLILEAFLKENIYK